MFVANYTNLTKFHFDNTNDFKEKIAMSKKLLMSKTMMIPQILKFLDSPKTMQKSKYLGNETFFLQMNYIIIYTRRSIIWQKNSFVLVI